MAFDDLEIESLDPNPLAYGFMQVNLKVTAGPYKGRIFSFTQHDSFLIGRNPDAHLCLPDDRYFSRNHCLLEMNPPRSFRARSRDRRTERFSTANESTMRFSRTAIAFSVARTILVVEVTNTSTIFPKQLRTLLPGRPVLVMVECLNCGRREQAQASAPDEHLTFLCEDCRIELKRSPQAIPGYDTVKLLGRGGMGCVMLGREQSTGRAVAIKTLLPEFAVSDKAMRRFMREIDVAAALKHKNIVEFIDRGTHNGVVYLVTEFVDGADASKLAETNGGRLLTKTASRSSRRRSTRSRSRTRRATFIATSKTRTFSSPATRQTSWRS